MISQLVSRKNILNTVFSKSIQVDAKMFRAATPLTRSVTSMAKQPLQKKDSMTAQKMQPVKALAIRPREETSQGIQLERPNLMRNRPISANSSGPAFKSKTQTRQEGQSNRSVIMRSRPNSANIGGLVSKSRIQAQKPAAQPANQVKKNEAKPIVRGGTANSIGSSFQTSCGICLQSLFLRKVRVSTVKNCGTRFHYECLKVYIQCCINSSDFSFKCPQESCNRALEKTELLLLVPKEQRELVSKQIKLKEARDNPSRFTFCSTSDCQHFFPIPTKDATASSNCPTCNKKTCLFCKVPYHTNLTCEEYQKGKPEELEMFDDFNKKLWMRCMNCKFWIEKNEGCNHMTCKCGNQFCYLCGVKWKTCSC